MYQCINSRSLLRILSHVTLICNHAKTHKFVLWKVRNKIRRKKIVILTIALPNQSPVSTTIIYFSLARSESEVQYNRRVDIFSGGENPDWPCCFLPSQRSNNSHDKRVGVGVDLGANADKRRSNAPGTATGMGRISSEKGTGIPKIETRKMRSLAQFQDHVSHPQTRSSFKSTALLYLLMGPTSSPLSSTNFMFTSEPQSRIMDQDTAEKLNDQIDDELKVTQPLLSFLSFSFFRVTNIRESPCDRKQLGNQRSKVSWIFIQVFNSK